ncbi:MAG: hypothetical protein KGZ86_03455, partial [Candidatus Latescibacteria bacterium]|nr:hypothetical protein [Candidatus Latescibacterota bacterium]
MIKKHLQKLLFVCLFSFSALLFSQTNEELPQPDSKSFDSLPASIQQGEIVPTEENETGDLGVEIDSILSDSFRLSEASAIYDFLYLGSTDYPYLIDKDQIKERIDFENSLVFYEIYRDSILVGIKEVIPLKDYFVRAAYKDMLVKVKESTQRKTTPADQPFDRMGLIPDIELPRVPLLGEGSRINISGSDRITFGGRQTFTQGFTQTATPARKFPELKMEQQLRVNLEGTIGERTKVLIDHDSQRDLAGRNTVKLTYTGTEDDVLQNLEFGDTRLVIPGTAYTGDLPSRRGLFGVSGKAKVGGVDLYAVASREESQG